MILLARSDNTVYVAKTHLANRGSDKASLITEIRKQKNQQSGNLGINACTTSKMTMRSLIKAITLLLDSLSPSEYPVFTPVWYAHEIFKPTVLNNTIMILMRELHSYFYRSSLTVCCTSFWKNHLLSLSVLDSIHIPEHGYVLVTSHITYLTV